MTLNMREREEGLHSTGLTQTLIPRCACIHRQAEHMRTLEIDKAAMLTAHRAYKEVIDPKMIKCLLQILAIQQLDHTILCGHIAAFPTERSTG